MTEPRVQYCTASDGVNLAFCTQGQGPALVYMPTFGTVGNLQVDWLIPARRRSLEFLTSRMQVIQYDRRGQGLSDREPGDDSLEAHTRDLLVILDRLALDRVALHAPVFAGPVAITAAALWPDRVSHLILANTVASMPAGVAGSARPRALIALLDIDWELHIQVVSRIVAGWSENEVANRVAAQARAANTLEGMRKSWRVLGGWDATDLLPRVEASTLVLETPASPFAERWIRGTAAGIPGAQLRHLDADTGDSVDRAVYEFVTGDVAVRPVSIDPLPAGTAVVLFTDIVDSTALTEQLGDAVFRARASQLDDVMRSGIRECGGSPVEGKVLGDGVMAVFASSRQAIDGARRCVAAADGTGLALHLGIHAGDVIREDDNVYGGTVNIASRICGMSVPGEILVSDVVRGMARSSAGVEFEDRGEQEMKGVGEPVRVYAVRVGVRCARAADRYARTTDGVRIAYLRVGSGPSVLHCDFPTRIRGHVGGQLPLHDALLVRERHLLRPGRLRRLRPRRNDMSEKAFLRATEAVVAACMQDERFTVIAVGGACPGAALYTTAHPECVKRLVCIYPVYPSPLSPLVRTDWSMGRRLIASAVFPEGPVERQRRYSGTLRDSISQDAWIAASESYVALDQLSVFEQCRCRRCSSRTQREYGSSTRCAPRCGRR